MTTLQLILVILGGLIALFFIFSFFLPAEKYLERKLEINAPAKKVYELISDFSNYKSWNPWSKTEPDAHGEMSGTPGKTGHKWLWDGKKIGRGYLKIKELVPGEKVISDLIFEKPRKMESLDIWKFESISKEKTMVYWGHRAFLSYPMGRIFGLMLDKMLGKDFEQGLKNLKELSES